MRHRETQMGERDAGDNSQLQQGDNMPRMGTSYTVAQLEVPQSVFELIAKKLKDAGYGHAFMETGLIDMSGVALSPNASLPDTEWRLSKDNKAMVARHKFMRPTPEMRGKKCILQGPGDMPTLAIYDGDPQWKGVFPMPDTLRDDET